jgi:hypothetical protein
VAEKFTPKKKRKEKKNRIFLFWGPIGTYSEKMAISSSFFGPENVVTLSLFFSLCHFFFHKNHLYESYLIFCYKVAEKFTPKKKKNHCLMNPQTHHYGWMLHEMVVKVR